MNTQHTILKAVHNTALLTKIHVKRKQKNVLFLLQYDLICIISLQNPKLSRQLNAVKLSQATRHIRWLKYKKPTYSETPVFSSSGNEFNYLMTTTELHSITFTLLWSTFLEFQHYR